MPDYSEKQHDFLVQLTEIIQANISDEKFGVSELASEVGMSRSNLLRKIQKLANKSASQFIREARLKKALELLKDDSLNVSEISFEVGFGSTSYFIKCFREFYGYPPGETAKREANNTGTIANRSESTKRFIIPAVVVIVLITTVLAVVFKKEKKAVTHFEKSIAVLPFKNDSNDSTNIYIVNGLMESILNNLQKIEDLRVISRTSVEKYRDSHKTIPEIAQELGVSYFVEGSGQKIGNQILLNVQLIDASDDHLWAEQYNKQTTDIFTLQQDVAKSIANKIEAIVTPEEIERIEKVPTDNLAAYDQFLKGLDLLYEGQRESLEAAIINFKEAILLDSKFARAYAGIAICYYYLDAGKTEKQYLIEIENYADKALLYDPQLPQSLVAKAFSYMHSGNNIKAVPFLEKALEYNPNSAMVINTLADFYTNYIPNTAKYLEYALKGIQLDIASHDSITTSFIYLHLSNALVQSGFINEALQNINKSLEYNPRNLYSQYVRAYILFAKEGNAQQALSLIEEALSYDTTRLDILQEAGKVSFYMRDYEKAYSFYKKYISLKEALNLEIYKHENGRIAIVLEKNDLKEESQEYFADFLQFAEQDNSIYKHIHFCLYYSYIGKTDEAIDQLKLFLNEENYHYWTILFLDKDPMIDNIKDLPEFKKVYKDIEDKFWKYHEDIKKKLKMEELI